MARNIDPVCKMCRREQMKLFLKGTRCFSPKCPIDRETAAARHARRSAAASRPSTAIRLREKQKLKRFYGVLEASSAATTQLATRAAGNTGEQLLSILERRLDNVVHRLGFAINRDPGPPDGRPRARHWSTASKCDIPSMLVKPGRRDQGEEPRDAQPEDGPRDAAEGHASASPTSWN